MNEEYRYTNDNESWSFSSEFKFKMSSSNPSLEVYPEVAGTIRVLRVSPFWVIVYSAAAKSDSPAPSAVSSQPKFCLFERSGNCASLVLIDRLT